MRRGLLFIILESFIVLIIAGAFICASGADENRLYQKTEGVSTIKNTCTENRRVKLDFFGAGKGLDIVATLPGDSIPAFRILIPEFIGGYPVGFIHIQPAEWTTADNGALTGKLVLKDFAALTVVIEPKNYYIDVEWSLKNISLKTLERSYANICFGVASGDGRWANRDFLPESRLNREEDGHYWHDRVAVKGAFVHRGGAWKPYLTGGGETLELDADILAVVNEAGTKTAFQMWDATLGKGEPGINKMHACTHLCPLFVDAVPPGGFVTIHGRAGISSGGLDDIWKLYQSLLEK